MRRPALIVLSALLLASVPVGARMPEPTEAAALQGKAVVGQARMRVWGFDVYDATLHASPGFDGLRFGEHRFALELVYRRRFDGADIAERSIQEMQALARLDESTGARWLQAMKDLFPDVRGGDRITGVHVPGSGARFYFNGRWLGEVADDAFSRLFFGIWLSPRTSEPALREALLRPLPGVVGRP